VFGLNTLFMNNYISTQLIDKYNVAGPRYTSYPTVPFWDKIAPTTEQWKLLVKDSFFRNNQSNGVSLYIHLPFCERLCTYCGCNTRITINHKVEVPYIEALLKEWKLYLDVFEGEKPVISEIHLGGGTPTFFSAENLKWLISTILSSAQVHPKAEFSFEGHPGNTTFEHLKTLYDLGFRRVSYGIQDFDPVVQKAINRVQTYEQVETVTRQARELGYTSINYDIIYGLPFQKLSSIEDTINKIKSLKPDRIAFYSYAHVPWIKPGQRSFTEADLPANEAKRALYELGRNWLEDAGYIEIGMDHFALPGDSLYQAVEQEKLHRNFMGYTASFTGVMIGLGVSSISDTWTGFAQNVKTVEQYQQIVNEGRFPIFRGHQHTSEDLVIRKYILDIMCRLETTIVEDEHYADFIQEGLKRMQELVEDGLVKIQQNHIKVTPKGKPFLRNICMALDEKLWKAKPETTLFSKII
jgi:oxygen-independent coproporphyrinogen III oxidase